MTARESSVDEAKHPTTRRWVVLYPLLAAVYSVLALAAGNSRELVRWQDLVTPMGIALAVAALAWLLAGVIARDGDRRAFLAFVAIGVFSGFGDGLGILNRRLGSELAGSLLLLAPVALAAFLVRRVRLSFGPISYYLTVVMVLLVGWVGGRLLWHSFWPTARLTLPDLPARAGASQDSSPKMRPDLFLIVLDKYAGHRSLLTTFGFDNSAFEDSLRQEGFFVPRAPRANYVLTFLALAGMLNWQYLDDVAQRLGPTNGSWAAAYPLIEDDRTWRALRRLGYRFAFLPSAFPGTSRNRFADVQLPDPSRIPHEFTAVWLRGTLLSPVLDRVCPQVGCTSVVFPYVPESADLLDWKFETIPTLAEGDRPVFVLAHLTVPHEPYVYAADCSHRRPSWPGVDARYDVAAVKAAYVAQVRCVNRKLMKLVKTIVSRSARPAVILLQADHGHGLLDRDVPALAEIDRGRVFDRTDIFAAYRFPPPAPPGLVNDSIGPVNAMRAVMRYYYGFDLPPLAEESFWSSATRPYDFSRVH